MEVEPTVGLQVFHIARMLRTRFDARARSLGLTRAQWRVVATLRLQEGVTQSQLAGQLEINSVTAGRILDRLQAAGCIERRADPVDRRVNRLYLTPGAVPLLEGLGKLGIEEESISLAGLSEAERAQLGALLQRVIDNIQGSAEIVGGELDED